MMSQLSPPLGIVSDFDRTLCRLIPEDASRSLAISLTSQHPHLQPEANPIPDPYAIWAVARSIALSDPKNGRAIDTERAIRRSLTEIEQVFSRSVDPYVGVLGVFADLSRLGLPVTIVSSNDSEAVENVIKRWGISDIVKSVHARTPDLAVSALKPSAHLPLMATRSMMLRAQDVWLVGDSLEDGGSAMNAAIDFVAVLTGNFLASELQQFAPIYILESIGELPKVLHRASARRDA